MELAPMKVTDSADFKSKSMVQTGTLGVKMERVDESSWEWGKCVIKEEVEEVDPEVPGASEVQTALPALDSYLHVPTLNLDAEDEVQFQESVSQPSVWEEAQLFQNGTQASVCATEQVRSTQKQKSSLGQLSRSNIQEESGSIGGRENGFFYPEITGQQFQLNGLEGGGPIDNNLSDLKHSSQEEAPVSLTSSSTTVTNADTSTGQWGGMIVPNQQPPYWNSEKESGQGSSAVRSSFKASRHFSELEKGVLLSLIDLHRAVLESRKGDAGTVLRKQRTWQLLAQEFNAHPCVFQRDAKQLRKCWENIKARAKKTAAQGRRAKLPIGERRTLGSTAKTDPLIRLETQNSQNAKDKTGPSAGANEQGLSLENPDWKNLHQQGRKIVSVERQSGQVSGSISSVRVPSLDKVRKASSLTINKAVPSLTSTTPVTPSASTSTVQKLPGSNRLAQVKVVDLCEDEWGSSVDDVISCSSSTKSTSSQSGATPPIPANCLLLPSGPEKADLSRDGQERAVENPRAVHGVSQPLSFNTSSINPFSASGIGETDSRLGLARDKRKRKANFRMLPDNTNGVFIGPPRKEEQLQLAMVRLQIRQMTELHTLKRQQLKRAMEMAEEEHKAKIKMLRQKELFWEKKIQTLVTAAPSFSSSSSSSSASSFCSQTPHLAPAWKDNMNRFNKEPMDKRI